MPLRQEENKMFYGWPVSCGASKVVQMHSAWRLVTSRQGGLVLHAWGGHAATCPTFYGR